MQVAERIGYPVLLKAADGGGGRGMRLVEAANTFTESLRSARSEAKAAFGSDRLIVERFIANARHVEAQILADAHGNRWVLGLRDCSTQRRNQKIIEESPPYGIAPSLAAEISAAALRVAELVDYQNAGTVEFLLASDQSFYFLEMNTRLQVEHPVTELVLGIDLVALQIRVAQGEKLVFANGELTPRGHAIEARLCAEDPQRSWLPQSGVVASWRPPQGPGIRVDHGLKDGIEITTHYDSMVAKVIAWGTDREEARRRLLDALSRTVLLGVPTNIRCLMDILRHADFSAGDIATDFLEKKSVVDSDLALDFEFAALACVVLTEIAAQDFPSSMKGWHSTGSARMHFRLRWRDQVIPLSASLSSDEYTIGNDREQRHLRVVEVRNGQVVWLTDGCRRVAEFALRGDEVFIHYDGVVESFIDETYSPAAVRDGQWVDGEVKSPMAGRVVRLPIEPGAAVRQGETLAVVEAMKMENQVVALRDGRVEAIWVVVGEQVAANQRLATLIVDERNAPSEKEAR